MRWAGHGIGPGYHWRNPGPNTDYYNPWTMHNSHLISQPFGQASVVPDPSSFYYGIPSNVETEPSTLDSRIAPGASKSEAQSQEVAPVDDQIPLQKEPPQIDPDAGIQRPNRGGLLGGRLDRGQSKARFSDFRPAAFSKN